MPGKGSSFASQAGKLRSSNASSSGTAVKYSSAALMIKLRASGEGAAKPGRESRNWPATANP